MFRKLCILICVSLVVICFDQLTKTFIQAHFTLDESIFIFSDFFNLTYARNYGAAFSFLEESNPTIRDLLMFSIAPVVSLIILALVYYVEEHQMPQLIALSLILGGALGNYFDRINYGYVVDFLDFHIQKKFYFPTFNLADMAIVCGMTILIWNLIKEDPHHTSD